MTKVTPTFSEVFFEESAFAMGKYTDVKIILSDVPRRPEYHLHKVILAAHSSFFRKLFRDEPKDVYEIGAVSKIEFEAILGNIYEQRFEPLLYHWSNSDTLRYLGCDKIIKRMIELELESFMLPVRQHVHEPPSP